MRIIDIPPALLRALEEAGRDPWPQHETLAGALLPVPKFDAASMLPEPVARYCIDIAHRMQCPIEYVAVSTLVALGSVIGRSVAVRPKQHDDWSEHPNIWGAVVGRPGQKKSPAVQAAIAPVQHLEAVAADVHATSMRSCEVAELTHKMALDYAKKQAAKGKGQQQADHLEKIAAMIAAAPQVPARRRYITNDATTEKLGELLRDNPRGMLTVRDELTALLESFNRSGREGDRAFYLEAWNGKGSFNIDRVGRGSLHVPALTLSVLGGIQPSRLEAYLYELRTSRNDGLLQRFQLMVYPDSGDATAIVDQGPDLQARKALDDIFSTLAHTPAGKLGATVDAEGSMPYFRFASGSAQEGMLKWLQRHEIRTAREDSPEVGEHLTKYGKLVPVLALVFHLVEQSLVSAPTNEGISLPCLIRAIKWSRFLEAHARRVYAMNDDRGVTAARVLAKHIVAAELQDGFTTREVYRRGWSMLTDIDAVTDACGELVDAGWLRAQQSGGKPGKGRPTKRYEINPAVFENSRATPQLTELTELPAPQR